MPADDEVRERLSLATVLNHYPSDCAPREVEALGSAGGFSGACFWRLATPRGVLCLRRWPREHPSRQRLQMIHDVLLHVERQGFSRAAIPLAAVRRQTFVEHDSHFWELSRWMPGRADYLQTPSPQKLAAAMETLAQFHVCAETALGAIRSDYAPGIARRKEQIERLMSGDLARLRNSVAARTGALRAVCQRVLERFAQLGPAVYDQVRSASQHQLPLQACMRDIWHDHVLFLGSDVSGIVDFGALNVETVAADIGRLLGSLAEDDQAAWQLGLDAYEGARKLSDVEVELAMLFDRTNTMLAGVNWIRWLFVEGRQFDEIRVGQRLDKIVKRLDHAITDDRWR